jgi:hypothetical protein
MKIGMILIWSQTLWQSSARTEWRALPAVGIYQKSLDGALKPILMYFLVPCAFSRPSLRLDLGSNSITIRFPPTGPIALAKIHAQQMAAARRRPPVGQRAAQIGE